MIDKYPRIYTKLKNIGHSPAKAAEIILDASRKNHHALRWVRLICLRRN